MKIEESRYQFSGSAPLRKLDKLRQTPFADPSEFSLDDLDLSFLDLLTAIATPGLAGSSASANSDAASKTNDAKEADNAEKTDAADASLERRDALSRVEARSLEKDDFDAQVDKDLALLKLELSQQDMQYMKQVVIPGLPILMGSVPFQSIFPTTPEGDISYKGFEVSGKLAELIEKGYKTGRPIRVELDANSAVVLKIRNGQVSAEFVSADKGALLTLQQELDDLRNKLALKNLPVGTLESKYQHPDRSGHRQQQSDSSNEQQQNP